MHRAAGATEVVISSPLRFGVHFPPQNVLQYGVTSHNTSGDGTTSPGSGAVTDSCICFFAIAHQNRYRRRLKITHDNAALQQRSLEITERLFRSGNESELDVQQARSLYLGTISTVPALELTLHQARNALSALLGRPPGTLPELSTGRAVIPAAALADREVVPLPMRRTTMLPGANWADARGPEPSAATTTAATSPLRIATWLRRRLGVSVGVMSTLVRR